jgi:mono/diheme cytochrome c family protein
MESGGLHAKRRGNGQRHRRLNMFGFTPKRLAIAFSALLVLTVYGDTVKIELPPEKGAFKIGPGVELAQGNCLICHSVEYVTSQPRLDRKFWEASVKKMREKYGAPIADEAVAALVDYLVATYGTADSRK